MTDLTQPWDRQPDEPAMWYERFLHYRDLEPGGFRGRNVNHAHEEWRKTESGRRSKGKTADAKWYEASVTWDWQGRAEAWDEHIRRLAMVDQERERVTMLREHANIALAMRTRAAQVMLDWPMEDVVDGDGQVLQKGLARMLQETPSEIRRWITEGIKAEREARGVSSAVMELALSVATMSDEEIEARLKALLAEAHAEWDAEVEDELE